MKAAIKRQLVSVVRASLRPDRRPLPRLLESGFATCFDGADPEVHRRMLEDAFLELGAAGASDALGLTALYPRLESVKYKYALFGGRWTASAGGWAFRLGSRLAAAHNLQFDVLVLRHGTQIPPHAHEGTVSGMLVLHGEVGIRTFDVLSRSDEGATLRPGFDGSFGPGGVSTSSDGHHNLHWISGQAPLSLVFRYSLTGLEHGHSVDAEAGEPRHYCLPIADAAGKLTIGRWVDQADAQAAIF